MSLRDQLLKAGIASKKDVRRVEQDLKAERKADQGQRKRAAQERAEQDEARRLAEAAATEARLAAKRAREEAAAAAERALRARNLFEGNQRGVRKGRVPFHHRRRDGRTLHKLWVDDRTAWQLRCGELAVACHPDREEYAVLSADAGRRLVAIAPELVVFLVDDTRGISDAEESFLRADWEPSLRPRRA